MKTLNKIAAAITLVAASAGANASLVHGAAGVDSAVFFIAYDPTTTHTLVVDLGINYSTIANNFGNGSWFSSLDLSSLVTAGTGDGDFNFSTGLKWNLAAARNQLTPGGATNGAISTVNLTTTSDIAKATLNSNTGAGFTNANGILNPIKQAITGKAQLINSSFADTNTANNDVIVVNSTTEGAAFDKSWGSNISLKAAFNTAGTLEESLAFYHWYLVGNTTQTRHIETEVAPGVWTLSSAGVLSYAIPASEVPVPAAAWLFGTGLIGLTSVARRRQK